jgi:hypothetical protein
VHTTTHRPGRRRRLSMLTVATLFLSGIAGLVSAIPAEASPAYALYAGTGMSSYNGDDRSALTANLWGPNDLSTDAAGNVYFADRNNKIVRKIDTASTPQIHLVRGTPSVGKLTTDGGLNGPSGVAIQQEDSGASGYIADSYNNVVWRLTGSTPFAGNNCGAGGFNGDGGPANTPGPMVQGCSSPWSSNPAMMNQPGGLGLRRQYRCSLHRRHLQLPRQSRQCIRNSFDRRGQWRVCFRWNGHQRHRRHRTSNKRSSRLPNGCCGS